MSSPLETHFNRLVVQAGDLAGHALTGAVATSGLKLGLNVLSSYKKISFPMPLLSASLGAGLSAAYKLANIFQETIFNFIQEQTNYEIPDFFHSIKHIISLGVTVAGARYFFATPLLVSICALNLKILLTEGFNLLTEGKQETIFNKATQVVGPLALSALIGYLSVGALNIAKSVTPLSVLDTASLSLLQGAGLYTAFLLVHRLAKRVFDTLLVAKTASDSNLYSNSALQLTTIVLSGITIMQAAASFLCIPATATLATLGIGILLHPPVLHSIDNFQNPIFETNLVNERNSIRASLVDRPRAFSFNVVSSVNRVSSSHDQEADSQEDSD